MTTDYAALKQKVLKAAMECVRQGPGYSQQRPVIEAVALEAGGNMWTSLDLDFQQAILTCWHDLFREGILSWGYNLDNPDAPFFHIPNRGEGKKR